MGKRIDNGWAIAMQSWEILKTERSILPFPILSCIACFLVMLSFVVPLAAFAPETGQWILSGVSKSKATDPNARMAAAAVLFAFYAVNYFVIVFFNVALTACAMARFRGQPTSFRYGMQMATARLPQVIAWALFAASVGTVLRLISERSQLVGKIVVGLIGIAWSIATFLVVPVLAVEGHGPLFALKRSSELISKSWGEGLAGNIGLGFFGLLLYVPGVLLFFAGAAVMGNSVELGLTLFAFGVIAMVGASVISSALRQIFLTGVYLYAAEQQVPNGFTAETLQSAFRKK